MIKKIRIVVSICYFAITSFGLFAQQKTADPKQSQTDDLVKEQGVNRLANPYSNGELLTRSFVPPRSIKGNKYYSTDWGTSATLHFNGGGRYVFERVNFDRERGVFMVKTEENTYDINAAEITLITYFGKPFKRFVNPETGTFRFMQVLYEKDDLKILQDYDVRIRIGRFNPWRGEVSDEFVPVTRYFKVDGDTFKKFKVSRKNLYAFFGKHAAEMRAYMKDQDISLQNDADLSRMFLHFKTLEARGD